jgi:hypothetical protein
MERAARKRAAFLLLEAQFPREGAPSFRANLQRPRRKCLANSRLAAELAESLVRWGFRNSDSGATNAGRQDWPFLRCNSACAVSWITGTGRLLVICLESSCGVTLSAQQQKPTDMILLK